MIFINQVGYYFLCNYQQYQAKREMKRELLSRLPNDQLELVILEDAKSLLWEEEGREFYLDNEMYDVVKQEKKNGKTYIYCINDKKEKQLLNRLAKLVRDGRDTRKHNSKYTVKYQLADFEQPGAEQIPQIVFINQPQYVVFAATLVTCDPDISIPPPKVSLT